MAKLIEHQMKMQAVMMTPTWAQELLDKNHPKNRTAKTKRIEQYARDMRQGFWILTPEAICVDLDGWLTNGQNRLSAVIRADVDVPMLLITGCPKKAIGAQDQGAIRNVLDVSRMAGDAMSNNDASCIRAMCLGLRTAGQMTNFEVIDFRKQHRQAIDFAFENMPHNVRGISQGPVRAVIARAYYKRHLRNRTRQFCEVLLSGLPFRPAEDSGAIRLRNWLLDTFLGGNRQRAKGARRWVTYAKTERALDTFHKEEEVTRIIERADELFPLPNEEETTVMDVNMNGVCEAANV